LFVVRGAVQIPVSRNRLVAPSYIFRETGERRISFLAPLPTCNAPDMLPSGSCLKIELIMSVAIILAIVWPSENLL